MDGISSAFDRVVSDSYFKIPFVPQQICAMTGVFPPPPDSLVQQQVRPATGSICNETR